MPRDSQGFRAHVWGVEMGSTQRNRMPRRRVAAENRRRVDGLRFRQIVVVTLLLLLPACGTRVDRSDVASNAGSGSGTAVQSDGRGDLAGGVPAAASPHEAGDSAAAGTVAAGTVAARSSVGEVPAPQRATTSDGPAGSARGSTAGPKGQATAATRPPTKDESKPALPAPVGGGGSAAPELKPLVLANVGTLSGPIGTVGLGILKGAQVWVKYTNAHGGLRGHPVTLTVYDDGGDRARYRSLVQKAIEGDHATAFLVNTQALTGEGSVKYLEEKNVPVIGTEGGNSWTYTSPMFFPHAASGSAQWLTILGNMAAYLPQHGKTKLGVVYCAEVPTCKELAAVFAKNAKPLGMEYIFEASASIVQPDYTAECLNARQAGVQILALTLDSNSVRRFAASCARQNYRPIFSGPSGVADFGFKDDPNLTGFFTASSVFPFFQAGTPATDEYQKAYREHGGGPATGGGPPIGWVAGKLLEKAINNLDQMPAAPTSATILQGLWTLKGDDLGGLTYPLTFTANKPTPPVSCGFSWAIDNKSWVTPDRFERICTQGAL